VDISTGKYIGEWQVHSELTDITKQIQILNAAYYN
jgi:hypothetical protein